MARDGGRTRTPIKRRLPFLIWRINRPEQHAPVNHPVKPVPEGPAVHKSHTAVKKCAEYFRQATAADIKPQPPPPRG